jgi:hypothetical protein
MVGWSTPDEEKPAHRLLWPVWEFGNLKMGEGSREVAFQRHSERPTPCDKVHRVLSHFEAVMIVRHGGT